MLTNFITVNQSL